jgi:NDP-sugar pyrophosphorylase family protein
MKALILAAGEGSRLRPLTLTCPKPMLPVGGRPLLEHIIRLLRRCDITHIAINLHYKPWIIPLYFWDGYPWGVKITYSLEETLLGSAGAAKQLQYYLDETFVVVYGDLYTEMDLSPLVDFHREKRAQITVALYEVDNPCSCGIVDLAPNGQIHRFVEKPTPAEVFSNLANAGIYIVDPSILDYVPIGQPYDFGRDLFPRLLAEGVKIWGYPIHELLIDIGTPAKYRQAQRICQAGERGQWPLEPGMDMNQSDTLMLPWEFEKTRISSAHVIQT